MHRGSIPRRSISSRSRILADARDSSPNPEGNYMSETLSIEETFTLLGKNRAWGLVRTHGSMFFLEIGKPLPQKSRRNVRGEWHFLVEMCHWRLATREAIIVGSEDDEELIDRVFNEVNLGTLDTASTSTPSHD